MSILQVRASGPLAGSSLLTLLLLTACGPGIGSGPGHPLPRERVPPGAPLTFPVAGHDVSHIRSWFGDPRDGGRRQHNGVDIFAPRGTLVLAAADGVVSSVATTSLGGRVVWLNARRGGYTYYYAHLNEQLVRPGQRVRAGEIIGRVGNTGNARTTPPHLHFGVYRERVGPVDPLPYLRGSTRVPPVLASRAPAPRAGSWVRASVPVVPIRTEPAAGARIVGALLAETPARYRYTAGSWFRIEVPDGPIGYVPARLIEAAR
jgi:peptidoglycan LD-endopeptidase LytH